ncbi:MAG TPA: GNAT family N-acetyltransferase [Chitinophagaceae bacterium]|nr:GNAT family N-acetyltransferase [Chitinophagaceae bacterium]
MVQFTCKPFDQLTPRELYTILQLRSAIFVVEQNCVFLDADDKDQASFHFMGWKDDALVAYTRLVPPGVAYEEPSIGRVVTAITVRGSGIGRTLMQSSIVECRKLFGQRTIKIGAQLYLEAFYRSLGFVPTGGIYPEDGIDHIHMLLS